MSGVSGATGSTTYGTNVPPVSFPGIASGIDYNSIIQKLTSMQLAPVTQLNHQIATLNAANSELIKINSMLASVQNSLMAISDPNSFNAFSATSGNTAIATAAGIANVAATPGTYQIINTQLATATQVTSNASAGHTMLDVMPGTTATGEQVALANSWTAIKPSNGTGAKGSVTIDGVSVELRREQRFGRSNFCAHQRRRSGRRSVVQHRLSSGNRRRRGHIEQPHFAGSRRRSRQFTAGAAAGPGAGQQRRGEQFRNRNRRRRRHQRLARIRLHQWQRAGDERQLYNRGYRWDVHHQRRPDSG